MSLRSQIKYVSYGGLIAHGMRNEYMRALLLADNVPLDEDSSSSHDGSCAERVPPSCTTISIERTVISLLYQKSSAVSALSLRHLMTSAMRLDAALAWQQPRSSAHAEREMRLFLARCSCSRHGREQVPRPTGTDFPPPLGPSLMTSGRHTFYTLDTQ
jgi:hypothetical protein